MACLKKYRPELNRQQRRKLAAEIVRDKRPHRNATLQEAIVRDIQSDVDGVGVFCLSDHADDILMWSHYGDSHRGFCLEFETTTGLGIPLDVSYSVDFPRVDFLRDSDRRQMEANLLTKAAVWSYEREWRILDTNEGPGVRQFPPEMLSGVVFGCKMTEEDRAAVHGWVESGPTSPKFYEAVIKEDSYSLEVLPLP